MAACFALGSASDMRLAAEFCTHVRVETQSLIHQPEMIVFLNENDSPLLR